VDIDIDELELELELGSYPDDDVDGERESTVDRDGCLLDLGDRILPQLQDAEAREKLYHAVGVCRRVLASSATRWKILEDILIIKEVDIASSIDRTRTAAMISICKPQP